MTRSSSTQRASSSIAARNLSSAVDTWATVFVAIGTVGAVAYALFRDLFAVSRRRPKLDLRCLVPQPPLMVALRARRVATDFSFRMDLLKTERAVGLEPVMEPSGSERALTRPKRSYGPAGPDRRSTITLSTSNEQGVSWVAHDPVGSQLEGQLALEDAERLGPTTDVIVVGPRIPEMDAER